MKNNLKNLLEETVIKVISKEIFLKRPKEKTGIVANTYYTGSNLNMMCIYSYIHRSDTSDIAYKMFSTDNGATWTKPITIKTRKKLKNGMKRSYTRSPIVDKKRNLLINFKIEGILPTDEPLEGLKWWHICYMVSKDNGKSNYIDERIILEGEQFNDTHPLIDVYEGKNSAMMGDTTELAIITEHQENIDDNDCILLPVQITPIGPNGEYINIGGGYTFHYSAIIKGKILNSGHIKWIGMSNKVEISPTKSTRGAIEPTIIELEDGRILMVLRGSNGGTKDVNCELPGYRWYSISSDGGKTFKTPEPWTYTNGKSFYSPSACSQLLKHSNNKIYWIGNISKSNPKANMPRNPIYMCEVDQDTLLLKEETLCVIDKVTKNQSKDTTFSNFYAREDKISKEIVLHITPFHERKDNIFGSDAYIYRIEVD